jgi:cell division protein FtsB
MAAARTASPARRAAPRRTSARAAPARPRTSGIRWDRLGRIALLVVLLGVLGLYVGPARSWLAAWQEARDQRATVNRLHSENAQLRARRAELRRPGTLEREARKLGMVRPGERAYVIEGLPRGR